MNKNQKPSPNITSFSEEPDFKLFNIGLNFMVLLLGIAIGMLICAPKADKQYHVILDNKPVILNK